MNLCARGVGGGLDIDEYIVVYCIPDMKNIGIQVLLNTIHSIILKVIVLVLAQIAGLTYLHQASGPLMFYWVE